MSAELQPTPETDAAIQSMPGRLSDFARKLERERDEARELLREIRDGEVNAQDEADKFLRDHKPSELSKAREAVNTLNQRLIERTADMLAKLGEVERTARLWEKRYNEQTATLALTAQERDEASEDLEREQMRLVACDVVAMSDTVSSRGDARDMHNDYWSVAVESVIRRVDECIDLREKVEAMRGAIKDAAHTMGNLIIAKRGGMQPANALIDATSHAKETLVKLKPFLKP